MTLPSPTALGLESAFGEKGRCVFRRCVLLISAVLAGCGGPGAKEAAIHLTGLSGPSEEGRYFFAYDALLPPKKVACLVVQLQCYRGKKNIVGHTITFRHDGDFLGRAITNARGKASLSWIPPGEGEYLFTAKVTGVGKKNDEDLLDMDPVSLRVSVRPTKTRLVVVDLDRTLVDGSFVSVLMGKGNPVPDSTRVMKRISEHYGIVYLTQRPVGMADVTKRWLEKHGYPTGPVLLSQPEKSAENDQRYKVLQLKKIQSDFPHLAVGVGDKPEDILAYRAAGMTAYWLRPYRRKVKNMRALADELRHYTETDVYVVADWRELERGLFGGETLSPSAFADRLDREADEFSPRR